MNRQSFISGVLGAVLAVIVALPAAAADSTWDELVAAAQREGKVELVLSGQVPQRLRVAMPEFEKKYGVRVNFQTGGGAAHISRLLAERRLNRYSLDVWLGGATGVISSLLPIGAAVPFADLIIDPEVKNPARWFQGKHHYIDPENRYIFVWGASPTYNVAYNTNLVDPNEIRSYADLLNPKWKGKIVSWSPGQGAGASTIPMFLNPKIGEQWFRRWANEMNVTIVSDARQGAEWVALGRFAIGMFGLNTQIEALKDQGFPVKDFLPHPMAEGEVLSASAANLMVLDKAPNPNAAKLFINWALSRDGQALLVKASEKTDSLRTDVPNDSLEPQYRIDPKVDYIVAFSNPEQAARQDEILAKLKTIMREAGYK